MGCACSQETLSPTDLARLSKLPRALLEVARFIQRIECDFDFLQKMHYIRVWNKTDESLCYVVHSGFHGYSLDLYWPIIKAWAAQKWSHIVDADDSRNVLTFRVLFPS